MICVDGTPTLKQGEKYLVECRGTKAKVIRDQNNPHHIYGNIVNMNRFKSIKNVKIKTP